MNLSAARSAGATGGGRLSGVLLTLLATVALAGMFGSAAFQATTPPSALTWLVALASLLAGGVIVWLCRWRADPILLLGATLARLAIKSPWWAPLLVGLALRLLSAVVIDPHPTSDGATYLSLANKLLSGQGYISAGTLAYWPPGAAFLLFGLLKVFGAEGPALLAFGLLAYGLSMSGIWFLGRMLGMGRGAVVAMWLVAIWPTLILCTGLPEKELVIAGLLPWMLWCTLRALRETAAWALVAGALLGCMVLTQPSMQLLPFAVLVLALVLRQPAVRTVVTCVLMLVAMAAVISPWTLRNQEVLGKPVLVSTNGGSNLYRANNELATGGYVAKGRVDLDTLPELEADAQGKRLAVEWILGNPVEFARLSLTKVLLFAGDDSYGAYTALKGARDKLPGKSYLIIKAVAALPWILMWIWIAAVSARTLNWTASQVATLLVLFGPYLYLSTLHAVFESGGRYHLPAIVCLFMGVAFIATQLLPSERRLSVLFAQLAKYGLVGVLNTIISLLTIYAMKYFAEWKDLPANLLGYAVGLCNSYLLNRTWTFAAQRPAAGSALRFIVVFGLAYGVNILTLMALLQAGVNGYIAQALAMASYATCSFAGSKFYAFKSTGVASTGPSNHKEST